MSEGRAVVTGASGGVGRALCAALAARDVAVLAVGRDLGRLAECAAADPGRIQVLAADLTEPGDRKRLREHVAGWGALRFLVHCAAVIEPIKQISGLDAEAFRLAYATNVEAPLFVTQSMLGSLPAGARILHLSSGAAHTPVAGCLAYCSSKAAFHMVYRVLQLELKAQGIAVGSASPGSVDTEMQRTLRQSDPRELLGVARFRELEQKRALVAPERAARFLTWLLLDCGEERFTERDWNIADAELREAWERSDLVKGSGGDGHDGPP